MSFIVFDLDDTLGCTKQRRHFIIPPGHTYATYDAKSSVEGFAPDWDAFFAARYGDEPILPMLELFHSLVRSGNHVEIWTAAREDNRELTQKWLRDKCGIDRKHLTHMRPVGDRRKTTLLKESWILSAPVKPDLFLDDHVGIIEMVRSYGIVGCAVGDHAY